MAGNATRRVLAVLGSTGSIGRNTLDVVGRHPERFAVHALTAHRNEAVLFEQCRRYRPQLAVLVEAEAAERLAERIRRAGLPTRVRAGPEALLEAVRAPAVDTVVAAIVGAAGLPATLEAARCGKRILLANKEALVVAGNLFMREVHAHGAELLPVDSEHNAIFQCMPPGFVAGQAPEGVRRILLTASGGPFRTWTRERIRQATPEEAVAHPNWNMGRKISVDSATMMNKGLEVIEACWLFGLPAERIEVVVHPQSVVHSLVEYRDGSVLAQLGNPDMRTPIAHALAWPDRIEAGVRPLDLFAQGRLDFEPPDLERFPCLRLAIEAWHAGGTAPAVLNAANEVAVAAFLDGRLPFGGIPAVIAHVLERVPVLTPHSLEEILARDAQARAEAEAAVRDSVWKRVAS
ncbi:MAG: 1-deoxy-D-xylulose-5-phosphate reductoisomerase [Gammaproteobacteria bacterium]|nr:MAG: 1-deoxy-D-xylulose-5-phosphate reductoisomerase [Gammaproteobacteria bacterium]